VSCAVATDCDDGDPCTTDDCPAGICTFSQQSGAAGADCELADFLARPPCTLDAKLLTAATTLVGKARTAVQVRSVPGVSAKVAAKAKKRADRALKKLGRKAKKARRSRGGSRRPDARRRSPRRYSGSARSWPRSEALGAPRLRHGAEDIR
jgi:hypothetical protein